MNHYVFISRTLPFHGVGGMEVLIWDLMTEIAHALVDAIKISKKEEISLSKIYSIPEMTKKYLRLFESVKKVQP